jgi:hypothetical protein
MTVKETKAGARSSAPAFCFCALKCLLKIHNSGRHSRIFSRQFVFETVLVSS